MTAVIDKNRIDVITISVYQVVGDTFLGKETDGDVNYPALKDGSCDEGRTYRKPHIESS